jgi:glucose-6-phosphate isomerase
MAEPILNARSIRYDFQAAAALMTAARLKAIKSRLLAARKEVLQDIKLLGSRKPLPKGKDPLDAAFIELPHQLLEESRSRGSDSLVGRVEAAADRIRKSVDRVVVLGIGGSYMGARAMFEALCHPYHNELTRVERRGVPRMYFEGNNLDAEATAGLLELLARRCKDRADPEQRWGLVVISKAGGTLETAVAFRIFLAALESFCGTDSHDLRSLVAAVTGPTGKLRALCESKGIATIFPIPDGVGGRYSVLSAVGLLPAALLGLNVRLLLQGAIDMTERFRAAAPGKNPVLDYAGICHLFERYSNKSVRVLATWGKRLEALGFWYDQLLSESLGKKGRGALPLTVVNTRDLHSRGQQHQEGKRDKLITNLFVEQTTAASVVVPGAAGDEDQLNCIRGMSVHALLGAAMAGTNRAYADDRRPTADLVLPTLDEYTLGQIMQMLMLATVVEGRMIDINPYGQPGVQAYKENMAQILGL